MEKVMKLLQKKGQRVTQQKKQVYCVLQSKPQSVLQISDALVANKIVIDKATIYRILTSFVEAGVIKEINLGDREARFELTGDIHHHHLVCEACGEIEDVELSENILLSEVGRQSKFKIQRHSLEFFGTCAKCQ